MGKFIVYLVVMIVVGGGIFLGGIMAGGAWGSGMAATSTTDEIESCMVDHADETQMTRYRKALAKCLNEASS